MNVVIVGAGTVGYSLAEILCRNSHFVSVIDVSSELCSEIDGTLDVFTVNGKGTNPQALERAGIQKADMVIAVTPSDDTNLVVCNFAKQIGVPKRIARIRSPEYSAGKNAVSLSELGVTRVIEPEKEVVNRILQYVELPGVAEAANFHSGSVYLRGYRVTKDMPVANKTLSEVDRLAGNVHILIVLIIRNNESILPKGSETILPGDEIVTIMMKDAFPVFRKLVDKPKVKLPKIVVYGDSLTATRLVQSLDKYTERIVLVDPDEEHGRETASSTSGIEVLEGDCTRVETLQDVHVETASFFIAVGNDTEDNIMACLLAKAEGTPEVIALSSTKRHTALFQRLGLDHIVNLHTLTAQTIITSILKVPIGALLKLKNVDVEVARFTVEKKSRLIKQPVSNMNKLFKKSVIIGSVLRKDEVIIPSGDTVIEEDDVVLVLSQPKDMAFVSRLFKAGKRVFI